MQKNIWGWVTHSLHNQPRFALYQSEKDYLLSAPVGESLKQHLETLLKEDSPSLCGKTPLFQKWENEGKLEKTPIGQAKFLAPLPQPESIRDGYAFRQHVETARKNRGLDMIPEFDDFPVFYFTNRNAVLGEGPVPVHQAALDKLDFELEAAIVLGKGGKNIPAEKADQYILGYMIFNDWSARALQMQEMKLNLGPAKGKDFANSFGPLLVSRHALQSFRSDKIFSNSVGERFNLRMRATLNGKQVSEGNLCEMRWSFADLIARASQGVALVAGEIIGSGTVGTGCFLELNGSIADASKHTWIKMGDTMELEIEQLGRLKNTVVSDG